MGMHHAGFTLAICTPRWRCSNRRVHNKNFLLLNFSLKLSFESGKQFDFHTTTDPDAVCPHDIRDFRKGRVDGIKEFI
jgi:hypothetical protein